MFKGPNGVGKGDKPRGMKISRREFENRWDKIFKHNGFSVKTSFPFLSDFII